MTLPCVTLILVASVTSMLEADELRDEKAFQMSDIDFKNTWRGISDPTVKLVSSERRDETSTESSPSLRVSMPRIRFPISDPVCDFSLDIG